jgi:hypothetical protein
MDDRELIKLTSTVISWIKPNKGDSESIEDCWQIAYVAGLQALRNAEHNAQKPSVRYLTLCMQSSVYWHILKQKRRPTCEIRDDDEDQLLSPDEFTDVTDADDFIKTHLSALTKTQARTLIAFFQGVDKHILAKREGIQIRALNYRLETSLKKLRDCGRDEERETNSQHCN